MLGDRIRTLRKEHGYSQALLARKLKITQGAISQWELGSTTPAADQLRSLADAFNISVDDLLEREVQEQPMQPSDDQLVDLLVNLSPAEVQRVKDFVAGIKASRTE